MSRRCEAPCPRPRLWRVLRVARRRLWHAAAPSGPEARRCSAEPPSRSKPRATSSTKRAHVVHERQVSKIARFGLRKRRSPSIPRLRRSTTSCLDRRASPSADAIASFAAVRLGWVTKTSLTPTVPVGRRAAEQKKQPVGRPSGAPPDDDRTRGIVCPAAGKAGETYLWRRIEVTPNLGAAALFPSRPSS